MKTDGKYNLKSLLEQSTRGLAELDAFLRRADEVSRRMVEIRAASSGPAAAPANGSEESEAAGNKAASADDSATDADFLDPSRQRKYTLKRKSLEPLRRFAEAITKLTEESPSGAEKQSTAAKAEHPKSSTGTSEGGPQDRASARDRQNTKSGKKTAGDEIVEILGDLGLSSPILIWTWNRIKNLLIDAGIEQLPGVKTAMDAVAKAVQAIQRVLADLAKSGEEELPEELPDAEELVAAIVAVIAAFLPEVDVLKLLLAALAVAASAMFSGDNSPQPPRRSAKPGPSPTPTPNPTAAPTPNPTANAAPDATPNAVRNPNQDAASAPGPAATPTQPPAAAPTPGAAANAAPNPAPNAQPTSANDGASMTVHYSPTVNVTVQAEAAAGGSLSELVRAEVIKALHSQDSEVRDAVTYAIEQAFENAFAGDGSRLFELFKEGMKKAFRSYDSDLEYTLAREMERVFAREDRCSFRR